MNFVQNILWNSIEGFVEAGTRTAGGYAGDALLKAGDLIEGAGRSVGNGIERTASSYGTKLSSGAPTPTTAKKPGVKRSLSSPATSKPFSTTSKPAIRGSTNKYPGGKTTTGAQRTIGGAQKRIAGTGTKSAGVGGTQKTLTNTAGSVKKPASTTLPKPYANNAPYGTSGTGKPNASTLSKPNNTPKPSTEKKTAVRPNGPPKPFNPPKPNNTTAGVKTGIGNDAKPYPGTNTLPGQGSRTPVRKQKYKPLPRLEGTAEKGKATFF